MPDLAGFGPQLLAGAGITLELAFGAAVLGIMLGLTGAAAKLSRRRWISAPISLLLNLLRGVPEFLILLIVYFGASELVGETWAPGPLGAGVLALGVVFGAYSSETFRGAFLAVPTGQVEAARAFGMTPVQIFLPHPSAAGLAGRPAGNRQSVAGSDQGHVAGLGARARGNSAQGQHRRAITKHPFPFYLAAMALYFAIVTLSDPAFAWLERRAARGYWR